MQSLDRFGLSEDTVVVVAASSSNTLARPLSEDAFQGDATFPISMYGTQLGAAQAVAAVHGLGGLRTSPLNERRQGVMTRTAVDCSA